MEHYKELLKMTAGEYPNAEMFINKKLNKLVSYESFNNFQKSILRKADRTYITNEKNGVKNNRSGSIIFNFCCELKFYENPPLLDAEPKLKKKYFDYLSAWFKTQLNHRKKEFGFNIDTPEYKVISDAFIFNKLNFFHFIKLYSNEEAENNFESIVSDFVNFEYSEFKKQGRFNWNFRTPGKILGVKFTPFEAFKEKINETLNTPGTEQKEVLKRFKDDYITKALEIDKVQKIYTNYKSGKEILFFSSLTAKFLYFATKCAIIELIKLEKYLNEFDILQKDSLNPEPTYKSILFDSNETIQKVHSMLKDIFSDSDELLNALNGKNLKTKLLFNHNQNKLVEVFKRLKYNGFIISAPTEINKWLCSNFCYNYKGQEIRNFNHSTVKDILTKEKGEPTKKERICEQDWLPYKTRSQREKEE